MNGSPILTVADSIPFISNVYETSNGTSLKTFDFIRIICAALMLLTIIIRIKEKYDEKKKKLAKKKKKISSATDINNVKSENISLFKIILFNLLTVKNLIILIGFFFYLIAFLYYYSETVDTKVVFSNTKQFYDIYSYAQKQRYCRTIELLSLYLFGIYSLKYLQFIPNIQILLNAFKKASFEYFSILAIITLMFIGLSILTYCTYGSYLFEYKNFFDSLIMNLKIFIFVENTSITTEFIKYYRLFSIIVLILFVFIIKYYALNLFLPILVEYFRSEYASINLKDIMEDEKEESQGQRSLTFKESNFILSKFFN